MEEFKNFLEDLDYDEEFQFSLLNELRTISLSGETRELFQRKKYESFILFILIYFT